LGLLGTEIAENFALRIFDTFSSNNTITLNKYLKYVDVYHYGDDKERCQVTFQMMDIRREKEVNIKDFEEYINLLIAAIRKVHPSVTDNFFSSKDIKDLFKQITTNNKNYFTEEEFLRVYLEKPDLLSWIDYFKNNDGEVLSLINNSLKSLLTIMKSFFIDFSKVMESNYQNGLFEPEDLKNYDLSSAIRLIEKLCKTVDSRKKDFMSSAGKFSIRTVFENLTKSFGDTNKVNGGNDASPKRHNSHISKTNVFKFQPNTIDSNYIYSNQHPFQQDVEIIIDNDKTMQDPEETKNIDMTLELNKIDSTTIKIGLNKVKRKMQNTQEILEENINEEAEETFVNENSDNRVNVHNIYKVPTIQEKNSNTELLKSKKKLNIPTDNGKGVINNNYEKNDVERGEKIFEKDADISKIEEMINSNYLVNNSLELSKNEAIILDDSEHKLKSVVGETGLNINMLERHGLNDIELKKKNTKENLYYKSTSPIKNLKMKEKQAGIYNLKVEEIQLNMNNESSREDLKKFFKKMKILSEKTCQVVLWIEESYKWVERNYLREPLEKVKKSVEEKTRTLKKS
jgi:hypothetical protein